MELHNFLKGKNIISYEDSKMVKKKINFVREGIDNSLKSITKNKCLGFTKKGVPCSRLVLLGKTYCYQHLKVRSKVIENELLSLKKKSTVSKVVKENSLKKELGQFFTTSKILQEIVCSLIKNNPTVILEPCVGRGDLVSYVSKKLNCRFDNFEIDTSLKFLIDKSSIVFTDFLIENISKKYKTIIANPPYSVLGQTNVYLLFIKKCFNLLSSGGELIFIVPSNFFRLSTAKPLRREMLLHGKFTNVYFANRDSLFKNATVSILVFRYVKDIHLSSTIIVNNQQKKVVEYDSYIYFMNQHFNEYSCLSNFFSFHVGLVSGADSVFRHNQLGNTDILIDQNKFRKYIVVKKFPTMNAELDNHLLCNKTKLINRRGRVFTNSN